MKGRRYLGALVTYQGKYLQGLVFDGYFMFV